MAILNHVFFGILILQIYVHAAPGDVSKLEDIAKVEKADESTLDPAPKEVESEGDSTETPRQKRQFYNPFTYGLPSISKPFYPSTFNNRDNYDNLGYGVEDPLLQIHKRVQELAGIVRQPPPPPITHIPIFYPVIFVPSIDCGCNPTDSSPTGSPTPTVTDTNTPPPNVTNRFPEMEDDRQNWGVVPVEDTNGGADRGGGGGGDEGEVEDPNGEDYSRPISFDKINRPTSRPAPPVEHGTVQSESGMATYTIMTIATLLFTQVFCATVVNKNSNGTIITPANLSYEELLFILQSRNGTPQTPKTLSPCARAILGCCKDNEMNESCSEQLKCGAFFFDTNPCDERYIIDALKAAKGFYQQLKDTE